MYSSSNCLTQPSLDNQQRHVFCLVFLCMLSQLLQLSQSKKNKASPRLPAQRQFRMEITAWPRMRSCRRKGKNSFASAWGHLLRNQGQDNQIDILQRLYFQFTDYWTLAMWTLTHNLLFYHLPVSLLNRPRASPRESRVVFGRWVATAPKTWTIATEMEMVPMRMLTRARMHQLTWY